ncbi:MAG: coiled-coil domain-containing protein [Collinsella intestinalis]
MELELASSQLATVKDDLATVQGQIEQTRADIEKKQAEVAEGQEVIAQRVSSTYKQGGANLLSIVLGSTDFADLFSRTFYANKVADADAKLSPR